MSSDYRWINGGSIEATGMRNFSALKSKGRKSVLFGTIGEIAYQDWQWMAIDPWHDSQTLKMGRSASEDEAKAHVEIVADTLINNRA